MRNEIGPGLRFIPLNKAGSLTADLDVGVLHPKCIESFPDRGVSSERGQGEQDVSQSLVQIPQGSWAFGQCPSPVDLAVY